MTKYKALLADTETNELDGEVIELAYGEIDLFATVLMNQTQEYFQPTKPISYGAMAVHHIIPGDLIGCRLSHTAKLPETEYLVGHNIDYDWRVLGEPECKRIDTLAMARYLLPKADSHTLSALIYRFATDKGQAREKLRSAHSAIADITLTHEVFMILLALGTKAGFSLTTWEDIYEFSEMARIPTVLTFGVHKDTKIDEVPIDYLWWLWRQKDLDIYLRKAVAAVLKIEVN